MNNQSTYNESMNGASKAAKDLKKTAESKVNEYSNEFNKISEDAGKKWEKLQLR